MARGRSVAVLALIVGSLFSSAFAEEDRTITQVVKLLKSLLDKSKEDADSDRTLYAKYKCYCDSTKEEKEAEIVSTDLLVSQVEELKAANAKLSQEVAKLDKDMKENEAAREEAKGIREKENTAFVALETDLTSAISTMEQAIQVLSDIGADQTMASAADHKQYMADYQEANLMKLKSTVKQALVAASAFVSKKQLTVVDSFIQAPFTGTYTSQSGQVVGILKDMHDTFSANLKSAQETEAKQAAAYESYKQEMEDAHATMLGEYNTKQGMLGENDGILGDKKMQLENLEAQIAAAREFLEKLETMCSEKKKEYDHRVMLRNNEQSALSEAIAILNSDAAFDTFGSTTATKTGATSLLQMSTVRRHLVAPNKKVAVAALQQQTTEPKRRQAAQEFLQKAAGAKGSSPLFIRVLAMLQANNPFATVLAEIEKMIGLLQKEGEADLEQKNWCDKERDVTNTDIDEKTADITRLTGAISDLENAIHDPETGLKATIKNDEESLQANYESQVTETKERKEDNTAYQKNIGHLVEAQALLERAVTVLKKYYEKKIHELQADLVQVKHKREEPAPPSTWEDSTYKGQSEGGTSAIDMLEFIMQNTKTEETQTHEDEKSAQHSYEDSMQGLKDEEETLQTGLAANRQALAEKEEELLSKQQELKKTEEEKVALEAYLEKIKPGCDFIVTNIAERDSHRATEKAALETAVEKIQGTPAYQAAMDAAHQEELGDCADTCARATETHVECKACLAKTSIPGYCAGHPSTQGC